jgi:hypothetical protein
VREKKERKKREKKVFILKNWQCLQGKIKIKISKAEQMEQKTRWIRRASVVCAVCFKSTQQDKLPSY